MHFSRNSFATNTYTLFYIRKTNYNYIPSKLSGFFITIAQLASRPWGGFDVNNIRKQYRYAFHNNRIPDDTSGDSNGDPTADEDEEEEEENGNANE